VRVVWAVLVTGCLISPSAGATASISIPSNTTVSPGDTFELPITIANASGLLGYYFELRYSPFMDFLCVRKGALTSSWAEPQGSGVMGRCYLGGYGPTPLNGSGTLLYARFRMDTSVPNDYTGFISFKVAELNDGALPVTTQSGTVTVQRIVIVTLPETIEAGPGETIEVPVSLDDATGVQGFFFELPYDGTILEYIDAVFQVPGSWTTLLNATPNRLIIAGQGIQPLTGAPTLLTLRFRIQPDTPFDSETTLTFLTTELNDGAIAATGSECHIEVVNPNPMPIYPYTLIVMIGLILMFSFFQGKVHLSSNRVLHRRVKSAEENL